MENLSEKIDRLAEDAETYLKTRERLTKLVAAEKSTRVASEMFSGIIIFLIFLVVFIFLSIAIAYMIAEWTGKIYYGFGLITLVYFVAGIIIYVNREKWLKVPMMNAMIKSFFKD